MIQLALLVDFLKQNFYNLTMPILSNSNAKFCIMKIIHQGPITDDVEI